MPSLIFAESNSHDPYFNLSFEKYLFDNVKEGELILYLWQNERTAVCGRNQNIYKECNLTALERVGGKVARRLSGGGAVFHDLGNINFSFIARDALYDVDKQLKVIQKALEHFGLIAEKSGRNDLTVNGRKFSGNAFHRADGVSCHHGTIMIDVDRALLEKVLTVSDKKLKSNGVDSVTSRIVNLRDLNTEITIEEIKEALLIACLKVYEEENFDSEIIVGSNNVISATGRSGWIASGSMLTMLQELADNKDFFASDDWIFGKNPDFTATINRSYDWGDAEICLVVESDIITGCKVWSDSLYPEKIADLEKSLIGKKYSEL